MFWGSIPLSSEFFPYYLCSFFGISYLLVACQIWPKRVSNLDIRLTHWYLCFLAFAVCCFSLQWVGDGLIAGSSAYADAEVGACGATRNGDILMCFHPWCISVSKILVYWLMHLKFSRK